MANLRMRREMAEMLVAAQSAMRASAPAAPLEQKDRFARATATAGLAVSVFGILISAAAPLATLLITHQLKGQYEAAEARTKSALNEIEIQVKKNFEAAELVSRRQQQQTQSELNEAKTKLASLDESLKRQTVRFEYLNTEYRFAGEVADLTSKIRPNPKVRVATMAFDGQQTITLIMSVKNSGKTHFWVDQPTGEVTTSDGIAQAGTIEDTYSPGTVAPESESNNALRVKITDPRAQRLRLKVIYTMQTDEMIIEALTDVLEKHPLKEKLEQLAHFKSTSNVIICKNPSGWVGC